MLDHQNIGVDITFSVIMLGSGYDKIHNLVMAESKMAWPWQPQSFFAMAPFLKMFRAAKYTSVPKCHAFMKK